MRLRVETHRSKCDRKSKKSTCGGSNVTMNTETKSEHFPNPLQLVPISDNRILPSLSRTKEVKTMKKVKRSQSNPASFSVENTTLSCAESPRVSQATKLRDRSELFFSISILPTILLSHVSSIFSPIAVGRW